MKRLVVGILAHVDSGKTTLSEGLLYAAGEINRMGRVDHRDAFLDTNEIERDRGITIFSKQAMIKFNDVEITLLDTPGHVDFSAEMERTLRVLDYAILVINGTDGVQSHTQTLWNLLKHYNIPVFIFVNKMDLPGAEKESLMDELRKRLADGCIEFAVHDEDFFENAALFNDELLEEYTNTGKIEKETLQNAIKSRDLFPCYFGSALKNEGVAEFLNGILEYTKKIEYNNDFAAKIFKIAEDEKGQRLTYLKVTGGILRVKDIIEGNGWREKVNEIRIYSGAKYKNANEVLSGGVCAVTGLSKSISGEGLGKEKNDEALMLEPVFTYSVSLPLDTDVYTALNIFRKIEEEETQIHILWNERLHKIDIQVMGEVQLEVLKRILSDRFSLNVEFENGSILYKETIRNSVEGVGHYEPLRHYAEVHLLLEPAKAGSGLVFRSQCSEDILDKNWQRLILTHLNEKTHSGVLIGAPITDMKITLVNGRAHQKHTEGGDFREATYRAVRQGLMQAESVILEPWYRFNLEIPTDMTGRAMTDLERMGAEFEVPKIDGGLSLISGIAPISAMQNYHSEVIAYTRGMGRISLAFDGYKPCKNQNEVIEKINYNPEADIDNTPDSIFCSHGGGFNVKWDKVFEYMHIPTMKEREESLPEARIQRAHKMIADEEELLRIFEKTYGKVKTKALKPMKSPTATGSYKAKPLPDGPTYLLIDGYNIIFSWEELTEIAKYSLEDARVLLIDKVCNYQAMKELNVIIVFDAYKVKGNHGEVERVYGIDVVYTKEAETADAYIEKTSKKLSKKYCVKVATSDNMEQIIIFGHGAIRVSASEFIADVESAEEEMRDFIKNYNQKE